ncbi:MAG TPA: multicopper oxidase domain-containing protein [Bacillota bacterium]|nr:multicopper oxidase domain-containing protein [Bacillota bacterium]
MQLGIKFGKLSATMFHCHILEHEDIGMMGRWHIMDMPME